MQIISDLHIHSKYSRAVSPKMNLLEIANWAYKKGIDLVTTGDWTHPLWFREIKNNLKEINQGVYSLKTNVGDADLRPLQNIKFLLTTEISSIYKQGGKTRRVHNLVFAPSLETAEKISKKLTSLGTNLLSDGRPITGISSHNLLELILTIDENTCLIPCHAWTPWYSIFGSKSGFDSIKECFGELSPHIYAIETGLSSDPLMNWQIKDLEERSIVSFSDAHSGPKLGREATVFITTHNLPRRQAGSLQTTNFSYKEIVDAIKQTPDSHLIIDYTIEFFPQEGKYHWSGHRSCKIRYNAKEVQEKGVICSVCKKPLTIGVENRVLDLSTKTYSEKDLIYVKNNVGLTFVYDKKKSKKPFVSLVSLLEILTEIQGDSVIKAQKEYDSLVPRFGTELDILMAKSYEEIEKNAGKLLSCAIKNLRERKVLVDPGFDGVFGKIKINLDEDKTNETKK